MKQSYIFIAISLCCISAVMYIGCTLPHTITEKAELRDPETTGTIIVLTKNGDQYVFDNYHLADSILTGDGSIQKNNTYSVTYNVPCHASIRLNEITYIETQSLSNAPIFVAVGVCAFVGGYSLSLLGTNSKLSLNRHVSSIPFGIGSESGSCPFVYTYDGNHYHFESETFAGAVFKGAERRSYDDLKWVKPVDGKYLMMLTNERPETEYTNEIKLHVVDIDTGSNNTGGGCAIVTDETGNIHTIIHPITPLTCIDFNGKNEIATITKSDTCIWESNVASKSFANDSEFQDGLIVEFSKPENAKQMKLIVNGGNTTLGSYAFKQLFKLEGDNILRWYQTLETDTSEANRFRHFMNTAGRLHISVWNGVKWIEQTSLADVGPRIMKDQLGVLDISEIKGPTVKVKLESATDLWRIDKIYADFSLDLPFNTKTLMPIEASDKHNINVLPMLRETDSLYYVSLPGDSVRLCFSEIPSVPGMQRYYVLETGGYYHLWYSQGEKNMSSIVEKMFDNPIFALRSVLPLWQKEKSSQNTNDN